MSRYLQAARTVVHAALAACFVAAAGPVASQSVLQFDRWMQKIDRRSQSIQHELAARDGAAALADAREVGELYRLMEEYFARPGGADGAVKLSRDGVALANAVVESLGRNDFEGASHAATSMTRACRDCHVRYKPLDP